MRAGRAPIAPSSQHYGGRIRYELHHMTPVGRGGGVYDLDNLDLATLGWVHWFNTRRILGPIGNIPPIEYEHAWTATRTARQSSKVAASPSMNPPTSTASSASPHNERGSIQPGAIHLARDAWFGCVDDSPSSTPPPGSHQVSSPSPLPTRRILRSFVIPTA